MSLKRYAAKRDSNEAAIVQALERVGAKVLRLSEFDLLAHRGGRLFMLDAKSRHGKATEAQARLIADGWPLVFVRSVDEALAAVGASK